MRTDYYTNTPAGGGPGRTGTPRYTVIPFEQPPQPEEKKRRGSRKAPWIFAAFLVLIVAPLFHTFSLDVPGPALACALAAGALASAFSYILWYMVVPKYNLVAISIIQLAIPIITAVLGAMFLSEAITLRLVVCTVIILGGIALAVSVKRHS